MKFLHFTLICFLASYSIKAQKHPMFSQYNHWVKTDIKTQDGSKIYENDLIYMPIELRWLGEDSLLLKKGSISTIKKAFFTNDKISFGGKSWTINKESDAKYTLSGMIEKNKVVYAITLEPKPITDLFYTPKSYQAKNGSEVFINFPGKLEPYFINEDKEPMQVVFENFKFPEYKKGGFVVRFIITETGEVKGARVIESTNEKYNSRLTKAVNATKGSWKPAYYLDKAIATEVEFDYNLDFDEYQNYQGKDSVGISNYYYNVGNSYFQSGSYQKAESYYAKSIEYYALNINAYFQHAAASVALRKIDEACKDYDQLIFLEQKKAEKLKEKYCK
ncbi:MAG: hypothetical protein ACRCVT_08875 [Leadbetterella sp.]